jgi:hypothetical protein
MNIRYRVDLSQSERDRLTVLLSGGKHPARKLKRAQILLAADCGAGDAEIAARVMVGGSTVYRDCAPRRGVIPASVERDSFMGFPGEQKSESMVGMDSEVCDGQSNYATGRF